MAGLSQGLAPKDNLLRKGQHSLRLRTLTGSENVEKLINTHGNESRHYQLPLGSAPARSTCPSRRTS